MLEKLREIISEQLSVDAADIEPATSFKDDLSADSLDLYEIIMAIEEEYSLEIPSDDLNSIATVEDVMNYLKNMGIEE